eukprot:760240-Hanusia_phi.AAC.3
MFAHPFQNIIVSKQHGLCLRPWPASVRSRPSLNMLTSSSPQTAIRQGRIGTPPGRLAPPSARA